MFGAEIVAVAAVAANAGYILPLVLSIGSAIVGLIGGFFMRGQRAPADPFAEERAARLAAEAKVRHDANVFAEVISADVEAVTQYTHDQVNQLDQSLQQFDSTLRRIDVAVEALDTTTLDIQKATTETAVYTATLSMTLDELKEAFVSLNAQLKSTQAALVAKEQQLQCVLVQWEKVGENLAQQVSDCTPIPLALEEDELRILSPLREQQRQMANQITRLSAALESMMAFSQMLTQQNQIQAAEIVALQAENSRLHERLRTWVEAERETRDHHLRLFHG